MVNANRVKALESLHDFFDHISGQKQATHQIGEDGPTADEDMTNSPDRTAKNMGDGETDVTATHNGPGSTAVPNTHPKSGDPFMNPEEHLQNKGPDANKVPGNPHDRMKELLKSESSGITGAKPQDKEGDAEEEENETKEREDAEAPNNFSKTNPKPKYDMDEIMRKAGRTGTGQKGKVAETGHMGIRRMK